MIHDTPIVNWPAEEAKATFLRAFKIWWSGVWRGVLILIILGELLSPGIVVLVQTGLFENFIIWMNESAISAANIVIIALIAVGVLALCYLFICLLFYLIIGNQYKHFRLDFIPEVSRGWGKICRVSCRYFIIATSISATGTILETLSLMLPFGLTISFCLSIMTWLLQIYAISFVVNRSYGNVHLSLIKKDIGGQK